MFVEGGTSLKLIVRWQGRYETFLSTTPNPHDLRPRYWRRQQKNEFRLLPDPPVLPSTTKTLIRSGIIFHLVLKTVQYVQYTLTFTVMLNERISNSRCDMTGKSYSVFRMYKINE